MLDAEQIYNFAEPRLGLAPVAPMPVPMLFWAGMFTLMMSACVGMMALSYKGR